MHPPFGLGYHCKNMSALYGVHSRYSSCTNDERRASCQRDTLFRSTHAYQKPSRLPSQNKNKMWWHAPAHVRLCMFYGAPLASSIWKLTDLLPTCSRQKWCLCTRVKRLHYLHFDRICHTNFLSRISLQMSGFWATCRMSATTFLRSHTTKLLRTLYVCTIPTARKHQLEHHLLPDAICRIRTIDSCHTTCNRKRT